MPTRDEMLCVLANEGIEVPYTATMSQIRNLFARTCGEDVSSAESVKVPVGMLPAILDVPSSCSSTILDAPKTCSPTILDAPKTCSPTIFDAPKMNSPTIVNATEKRDLADKNVTPDDEIRVLQQRLELLELRQRTQALEIQLDRSLPPVPPSLPSPIAPPVCVPNLQELVETFNGDSGVGVEEWFRDFERACSLYRISEEVKFVCMRRLLTDTAALFAKTSDACTYDDLKIALIQTFAKKPSVEDVFRKLRARRLSQHESVTRYVLEMQQIAGTAIPEEESQTQTNSWSFTPRGTEEQRGSASVL
uniref:Retrotransposon gag domain-containing protein n=1 Tax=Anopheles maculatus TaxID=74869 RepID=A0A182SYQ3_9DIPT